MCICVYVWGWVCVQRGQEAVYGSTATVWQVYHSIIKSHIITYNPARMTITGGKAGPQRQACCVLSTFFPSLSFTFFFCSGHTEEIIQTYQASCWSPQVFSGKLFYSVFRPTNIDKIMKFGPRFRVRIYARAQEYTSCCFHVFVICWIC